MKNSILNGSTPTIVALMVAATDKSTAQTGLDPVPTAYISKNGGAFAATTNAFTEIGGGGYGWYALQLTAEETGTDGPLIVVAWADGTAVWRDVFQVYTTVPAAMASGETVDLATGEHNKIADHVWRRHTDAIEASSNGDSLQFKSPIGAIAKFVHDIVRTGGTLYIKTSDGSTLGTQTADYDPAGQPISGLTTD
ncbi:MAG: hypothetical protein R3A10_07920 [Caldilineaceae bacterium]